MATGSLATTTTEKRQRKKSSGVPVYIPLLFLLPAILLLIAFRYIPAFSAVYHSFTDWTGTNNAAFVGLAQYQALLADPVFWTSLRNVVLYTLGRTLLTTTMAFIAAELVYNLRNRQAQWLWRVAFTLPMVIPATVILLIWQQIYAARLGLLNELLRAVGLEQWAQPWLGQPDTALLAIMMIGFPLVSGFAFLVISSALMELSTEMNEASLLDGCSPLRRVFAIDIPSIIGPSVLVIILGINAGLQEFAPMLIITKGGPANATQTPGLYLYQVAFTYGKFGYATAIGTVLMMITLAFSFFTLRARYQGATDVEVQ
jgi:raffinose/stachyose/melibiose transport system permease protein